MSIREDLKAWIDGELPPDRAQEVQTAVDSDPALEQEVRFMRLLSSEIAGAGAQAEVKGAEKAMQRVKGRRLLNPALGWSLAGALMVVGGFAVWPVFSSAKEAAKMSAPATSSSTEWATLNEASTLNSKAPPPGAWQSPLKRFVDQESSEPKRFQSTRVESTSAPSQPAENLPTGSWFRKKPVAGREIIRTANLGVRVVDVEKAQEAAHKVVTGFGGFVSASSISGTEGERPTASSSLRVPAGMFDSAVTRILALGATISKDVQGDDVTAEVADTTARLKVMRAEEESYVTMLRAARRVGELLEIKERLSRVRQEIESLESQRTALKDLASLSTIYIEFETKPKIGEPKPADDWTDSTWTSAVNALKEAGRFIGQGFIFLFVLAPVWIPVLFAAWTLARRARRS